MLQELVGSAGMVYKLNSVVICARIYDNTLTLQRTGSNNQWKYADGPR